MVTQTVRCERHGEATRLTCVDCETPICPKCSVRTEVGLKCEPCAKPAVETPVGRRRNKLPLLLGLVGLAAAATAAVLLLRTPDAALTPVAADPIGSWEAAAELGSIRGTTVAVGIGDEVLVAGGGVGAIPLDAAERYEPGTGQWRATGVLDQPRRGHAGVALPDGRVLVAGGFASGEVLASAEVYDPETETWSRVDDMLVPRLGHSLTVLADGTVLAAGGTSPEGEAGAGGGQTISPEASAELFDPGSGSWEPAGAMAEGRFEHTATLLGDGRVLVAGGLGGPGVELAPLASAELYDPATGSFLGTNAMAEGRTNHTAVALSEHEVLVVGGSGGERGDAALATAEVFNAREGSWTDTEALTDARTGSTATLLGDGHVLVAGGELVQGGTRRSLSSAELFDPEQATWVPAGEMSCPRSEHAAVLLPDDTVLVVAGDAAFPGQAPAAQSCADRYHPD